MKCVGIIAEYNPFHNGHAYHIKKAKELTGADHVIVVMSGSFVQRGEVAVCDKLMRARHALLGGADMVLELPTPFSLSNAETFARGAIALLASTRIVDTVCFGSMCGDTELLTNAAKSLLDEPESVKNALTAYLGSGMSYPKALSRAFDPEISRVFTDANDILGVEYIKAIISTGARLTPLALKRNGPAHDSPSEDSGFTSGRALRAAILAHDEDTLRRCMPEYAAEEVIEGIRSGVLPRENRLLSQSLLYKLCTMGPKKIGELADVSEGLENVIFRAACRSADYDSLIAAIKTKRYTMARIKRALFCALIGVAKEDVLPDRLFLRVLGIRKDALLLLGLMSEKAVLPVITRYSEYGRLSPEALRVRELDILAAWLSDMAVLKPAPPKLEYTYPLLLV